MVAVHWGDPTPQQIEYARLYRGYKRAPAIVGSNCEVISNRFICDCLLVVQDIPEGPLDLTLKDATDSIIVTVWWEGTPIGGHKADLEVL